MMLPEPNIILSVKNNDIAWLRRLLADDSVDVDEEDIGGWTALHQAVDHENVEAIRLLLEHGGDPTLEKFYIHVFVTSRAAVPPGDRAPRASSEARTFFFRCIAPSVSGGRRGRAGRRRDVRDEGPVYASSHHLFSSRTWASSSGVKSLTMLKVLRISSGVLPLIIEATVAQVRSRRGLMSM